MERRFQQLDVFSDQLGCGNPLAVVVDADGLTDEQMARFAAWTNLSETTFLLPPTSESADYRVRIFTPNEELPFAGHPTLGSCRAWLNAGGRPRDAVVIQECAAGLVPVRVSSSGELSFAAPPLTRSGPVDAETFAEVHQLLGVEPRSVSWGINGPRWIVAELASATQVLQVSPALPEHGAYDIGVFGAHDSNDDGSDNADQPDYEVRAFFPCNGAIVEDPVTGSLNAAIGQILLGRDPTLDGYTARQGTAMGRDGRIRVTRGDNDSVWVGGHVVSAISGALTA